MLKQLKKIEQVLEHGHVGWAQLALGLLFILLVLVYALNAMQGEGSSILVVAAMVGAYMAMNIGANDVANNVGPAVGARVLSLGGALMIAAVFEAAGALIAGGDVVNTIRSGIIEPELLEDSASLVWLMLAALLAGALWLNMATAMGAPTSTTHSIVGAVLGAGVAAGGFGLVNWDTVGAIVASWVVSPVLGGLIAAAFLYLIKHGITYQQDMASAARRQVPLLVALMAWAFTTYLLLKGLNRIVQVGFVSALVAGGLVALLVHWLMRVLLLRRASSIQNSKESINRLFGVPLMFAAALLSFSHGSNDVANAVAPLAAIVAALQDGAANVSRAAPVPLWVMVIGALGIAIGLALYGARVIRTVGTQITELDPMRAYCIAMSATVTVIVASQLGLPVSTTHVTVGGVFGVGFLREYLKTNYDRIVAEIKAHHPDGDQQAIDAFMASFTAATISERGVMLRELKRSFKEQQGPAYFSKADRKDLNKQYKRELVKRSMVTRIVAAWVVTVPVSAVLAALLYYSIRGMLLP
jgi:inorganic phosphate transporter, PiT family